MRTTDLLPIQLDGEPLRWFSRLCEFCLAGSSRTLESIWRSTAKSSKGKRPPSSWYRASERWEWPTRAAAFDRAQFQQEALELQATRREERVRRRAIVSKLGEQVKKMLRIAATGGEMPVMLPALARVYLSSSRDEFGCTEPDLPQAEPMDLQQPGKFEWPELQIVVTHQDKDGNVIPKPAYPWELSSSKEITGDSQNATAIPETTPGFFFERT